MSNSDWHYVTCAAKYSQKVKPTDKARANLASLIGNPGDGQGQRSNRDGEPVPCTSASVAAAATTVSSVPVEDEDDQMGIEFEESGVRMVTCDSPFSSPTKQHLKNVQKLGAIALGKGMSSVKSPTPRKGAKKKSKSLHGARDKGKKNVDDYSGADDDYSDPERKMVGVKVNPNTASGGKKLKPSASSGLPKSETEKKWCNYFCPELDLQSPGDADKSKSFGWLGVLAKERDILSIPMGFSRAPDLDKLFVQSCYNIIVRDENREMQSLYMKTSRMTRIEPNLLFPDDDHIRQTKRQDALNLCSGYIPVDTSKFGRARVYKQEYFTIQDIAFQLRKFIGDAFGTHEQLIELATSLEKGRNFRQVFRDSCSSTGNFLNSELRPSFFLEGYRDSTALSKRQTLLEMADELIQLAIDNQQLEVGAVSQRDLSFVWNSSIYERKLLEDISNFEVHPGDSLAYIMLNDYSNARPITMEEWVGRDSKQLLDNLALKILSSCFLEFPDLAEFVGLQVPIGNPSPKNARTPKDGEGDPEIVEFVSKQAEILLRNMTGNEGNLEIRSRKNELINRVNLCFAYFRLRSYWPVYHRMMQKMKNDDLFIQIIIERGHWKYIRKGFKIIENHKEKQHEKDRVIDEFYKRFPMKEMGVNFNRLKSAYYVFEEKSFASVFQKPDNCFVMTLRYSTFLKHKLYLATETLRKIGIAHWVFNNKHQFHARIIGNQANFGFTKQNHISDFDFKTCMAKSCTKWQSIWPTTITASIQRKHITAVDRQEINVFHSEFNRDVRAPVANAAANNFVDGMLDNDVNLSKLFNIPLRVATFLKKPLKLIMKEMNYADTNINSTFMMLEILEAEIIHKIQDDALLSIENQLLTWTEATCMEMVVQAEQLGISKRSDMKQNDGNQPHNYDPEEIMYVVGLKVFPVETSVDMVDSSSESVSSVRDGVLFSFFNAQYKQIAWKFGGQSTWYGFISSGTIRAEGLKKPRASFLRQVKDLVTSKEGARVILLGDEDNETVMSILEKRLIKSHKIPLSKVRLVKRDMPELLTSAQLQQKKIEMRKVPIRDSDQAKLLAEMALLTDMVPFKQVLHFLYYYCPFLNENMEWITLVDGLGSRLNSYAFENAEYLKALDLALVMQTFVKTMMTYMPPIKSTSVLFTPPGSFSYKQLVILMSCLNGLDRFVVEQILQNVNQQWAPKIPQKYHYSISDIKKGSGWSPAIDDQPWIRKGKRSFIQFLFGTCLEDDQEFERFFAVDNCIRILHQSGFLVHEIRRIQKELYPTMRIENSRWDEWSEERKTYKIQDYLTKQFLSGTNSLMTLMRCPPDLLPWKNPINCLFKELVTNDAFSFLVINSPYGDFINTHPLSTQNALSSRFYISHILHPETVKLLCTHEDYTRESRQLITAMADFWNLNAATLKKTILGMTGVMLRFYTSEFYSVDNSSDNVFALSAYQKRLNTFMFMDGYLLNYSTWIHAWQSDNYRVREKHIPVEHIKFMEASRTSSCKLMTVELERPDIKDEPYRRNREGYVKCKELKSIRDSCNPRDEDLSKIKLVVPPVGNPNLQFIISECTAETSGGHPMHLVYPTLYLFPKNEFPDLVQYD